MSWSGLVVPGESVKVTTGAAGGMVAGCAAPAVTRSVWIVCRSSVIWLFKLAILL